MIRNGGKPKRTPERTGIAPRQAKQADFQGAVMISPSNTDVMDLDGAIEAVEETYEFMLAYAAQGRRTEEDSSTAGIRAYLQRADTALAIIAGAQVSGDAAQKFFDVVRGDAAKAGAALRLVLAQPSISSQLVDNLNASIHLRALLTDLFLLDEALKISGS
jgi:hypothetical protein